MIVHHLRHHSLSNFLIHGLPSLHMLPKYFLYSPPPSQQPAKKQSPVKILTTLQNNIYLNIALQEYLFQKAQITVPTLFIWRNTPTIVIGRNQNPYRECHLEEMKSSNVKLSRRKSGGGAVYQDLGNTCFSFFTPYKKDEKYDYRTVNNSIILNGLEKLGIKGGQVSGRNDLVLADGRKFSGSAYRLALGNKDGVGRKALHHGTIMFSVDFKALERYLNPSKKKLESKGVQSVRSRVVNLQQIKHSISHRQFQPALSQAFIEYYGGHYKEAQYQQISLEQIQNKQQDNELVHEQQHSMHKNIKQNYTRLQSWQWLYGECPYFKYTIEHKFQWGLVELTFEVKNSIIQQCKVYSDCLYPEFISKVNEMIIGIKYDKHGIKGLLSNIEDQYMENEGFKKMGVEFCSWVQKQMQL